MWTTLNPFNALEQILENAIFWMKNKLCLLELQKASWTKRTRCLLHKAVDATKQLEATTRRGMTSTCFMISFGSPSFRAEILPLSMQFEIEIGTHLQCKLGIDRMKGLLAREFASPLRIKLKCRPSFFQPRDRDVRADPPLEGGSDPDLAGQATLTAWIATLSTRRGQCTSCKTVS